MKEATVKPIYLFIPDKSFCTMEVGWLKYVEIKIEMFLKIKILTFAICSYYNIIVLQLRS